MSIIVTYKKYLKISALIWLVCLVVFVLSYLLVISPQNKMKEDTEKEFIKKTQEYEFAQRAAREETKAQLNKEIEHLENQLSTFVLDDKDAADLTFDISRIADESNVTSLSIRGTDNQNSLVTTEPNDIFEKHITVSFLAGFQEFALFLNALERHQPVLFINEFMLSSQNKEKTTYQVTLDVAVFVHKQPSAIAKQDAGNEKVMEMKL